MSSILDTSVAILLRDGDPEIMRRIADLSETIFLSVISRVELEGGVYRFPDETRWRRARLDLLLEAIPVLDFGTDAADAYSRIVQAAGYSRRKILDRMIAAQALASNATLITSNGDDFRDIPGLTLVEW